ncbi:MAG: hypothetical protein ACFFFT_04535 [Candidatus Thorarchaeota archaeon]
MAQMRSTDWVGSVWKVAMVGGVLALIGVFLPATGFWEEDVIFAMWYFGYWFAAGGGDSDSGFADDFFNPEYADKYMTIGITATVLLIIAMILMFISANQVKFDKDKRVAAGTSLIGGILSIVAPAAYYGYMDEEFSGWWVAFDTSIGFYLPIIAGIIGIIFAIAIGYAYTQEQGRTVSEYQPQPVQPTTTVTQVDDQSQQEKPRFCQNCGTKLVGEYCQECGQKAEF